VGEPTPLVDESHAVYEGESALGCSPVRGGAPKDAESEAKFDEADRIDALATTFDILSIIIAIGLFLFGVASLVRQERIKIGLGLVGTLILVFSIIRLVHLGNPAGVGFQFLW
jgi:hypothetical protein